MWGPARGGSGDGADGAERLLSEPRAQAQERAHGGHRPRRRSSCPWREPLRPPPEGPADGCTRAPRATTAGRTTPSPRPADPGTRNGPDARPAGGKRTDPTPLGNSSRFHLLSGTPRTARLRVANAGSSWTRPDGRDDVRVLRAPRPTLRATLRLRPRCQGPRVTDAPFAGWKPPLAQGTARSTPPPRGGAGGWRPGPGGKRGRRARPQGKAGDRASGVRAARRPRETE